MISRSKKSHSVNQRISETLIWENDESSLKSRSIKVLFKGLIDSILRFTWDFKSCPIFSKL